MASLITKSVRSSALARFEEAKADPGLLDVLFQRVAEGETFREVCDSWKLPYGLMANWIGESDERRKQYDAALAFWADSEAQKALRIADDCDPEEVAKARLQVDVRLKLASRLDKSRYGNATEMQPLGLGGGISIVIAGVQSPYEKVGEVIDAE